MNTRFLKIKIEIPIEFDTPDENGVIHSREAYENMIRNGLQNVIFEGNNNQGNSVPLGTGNVTIEDNTLIFNGIAWSGGFSCEVLDADLDIRPPIIKNMRLTSIGFDPTVNEIIKE